MTAIAFGDGLRERLIDAQEAAHRLNLQIYFLTHPKERLRRQVPHYRVGKLVRFKLSELMLWMQSQQTVIPESQREPVDA